MSNLTGIVSAISAGAQNDNFTSTTSCVLMLIVVISLLAIPVIASKLRKAN